MAWIGDLQDSAAGLPLALRFDLGDSHTLWQAYLWNSLWVDSSRSVRRFAYDPEIRPW